MLLLAPEPFGESLALQLTSRMSGWNVVLKAEQLKGAPKMVIWSIDALLSLPALQQEVRRLQERWQPAPLLLLLPESFTASRDQLLALGAEGLLQSGGVEQLTDAIETMLSGGRVVQLQASASPPSQTISPAMGLGQWLLVSGLQQISNDLQVIEAMLKPPPKEGLLRFLLEGRCRELHQARALLLWLWGPLQMGLVDAVPLKGASRLSSDDHDSTSITLRQRNAAAVWDSIHDRLADAVQAGLSNATGRLLAIEALQPERRRELLLALLQQLDQLLARLRRDELDPDCWNDLQPELRRQALTSMAGSYVRIPRNGALLPVAAALLDDAEFTDEDEDLPDPIGMLAPLLADQPVLVNGQLLPADDPRALLQLETLVSNWLVRTAELIGAELLEACGSWPELRRYMLGERLLATRELDRVRNQLNSQLRWADWIERPIQLYESRRLLFELRGGRIQPRLLTEPRDEELNQLGWWQRQVALLLETRDALAPQVQAVIQRLGDLAVVLLTQVLGRAIGLIGRGIAQGMGRGLGRG